MWREQLVPNLAKCYVFYILWIEQVSCLHLFNCELTAENSQL